MAARTYTTPANLFGEVTRHFAERSSASHADMDRSTILSALVTKDGTIVTYELEASYGTTVRVATFDPEGHCKYDMILNNNR